MITIPDDTPLATVLEVLPVVRLAKLALAEPGDAQRDMEAREQLSALIDGLHDYLHLKQRPGPTPLSEPTTDTTEL